MQSTSRIPQHRGVMPPKQRTSAHLQMFLMAIVFSCISSSQSFNMQMGEYKPPVKSSVGKLRDGRFSRDLSASHGTFSRSRPSSSKSASAAAGISYYETASDLSSSRTSDDSFEKRMRDMVLGNEKQREVARTATVLPTRKFARKLTPTILPPNVHKIETLQDYKTMVADETDSVVAVRFYAPWCKACRAVAPLFYHMATVYPDVKFVDVPVTNDNGNLHQGLGVPSLPYGHIYHPSAGLVEELKLTRKFFPEYEQSLHSYYTGSCDLPAFDAQESCSNLS